MKIKLLMLQYRFEAVSFAKYRWLRIEMLSVDPYWLI